MREILYNKQKGSMNKGVASRMSEELQDQDGLKGVNEQGVTGAPKRGGKGMDEKVGNKERGMKEQSRKEKGMKDQEKGMEEKGVQEKGAQQCGSGSRKSMEDLVRQLEELRADMAVVKGYIVALQMPLIDRCNTWVDGLTVRNLLHITSSTLKAMRENGTMPYSLVSKRLFYNVQDLDGLLRKNYVKGIKAGGADE